MVVEYMRPGEVATPRHVVDAFDGITDTDPVERPAHYVLTVRGVQLECIDVIRALIADEVGETAYYFGNLLKYLWRRKRKGTELQDLRKARQYLDWLIEHKEAANDPR